MKYLFISFLLASSLWAASEPTRCYQVGEEEVGLLIRNPEPDRYLISIGMLEFSTKLNSRAKCIDCNEDIFEAKDQPAIQVIFKGKRSDVSDPYSESGTVNLLNLYGLQSYVRIKCPRDVEH